MDCLSAVTKVGTVTVGVEAKMKVALIEKVPTPLEEYPLTLY